MFTILIAGLLALGAFTALTLVSFAIAAVVSAICSKLQERNKKREIMLPKDMAKKFIRAVGEEDRELANKLDEAFNDSDGKLGFEIGHDDNVSSVETLSADDTNQDDIQDVTQIYADGRYKYYT